MGNQLGFHYRNDVTQTSTGNKTSYGSDTQTFNSKPYNDNIEKLGNNIKVDGSENVVKPNTTTQNQNNQNKRNYNYYVEKKTKFFGCFKCVTSTKTKVENEQSFEKEMYDAQKEISYILNALNKTQSTVIYDSNCDGFETRIFNSKITTKEDVVITIISQFGHVSFYQKSLVPLVNGHSSTILSSEQSSLFLFKKGLKKPEIKLYFNNSLRNKFNLVLDDPSDKSSNFSELFNSTFEESYYCERLVVKAGEKSWELPKYQQTKRANKMLEPYQQIVLLSLLNQYCSFTLEKPMKQSKVHITIPRLTHLQILDETPIELTTLTLQQCSKILAKDLESGISENTAQKRFEKNKKTFVTNFLMDIALEFGFFFDSQLTRKSGRTLRIERINHIYRHGCHVMNKSNILSCGEALNQYFSSLIGKERL
ncbi:hypothetical protein QTN25_009694 [Entamoeba marina]